MWLVPAMIDNLKYRKARYRYSKSRLDAIIKRIDISPRSAVS